MKRKNQDKRYERLYTQLLTRAEELHQSNKRRIRRGLIGLLVLPLVLGLMLWMTGSSKIVFLIIWIFCMFALSAYLITVEYIDDSIQKTLREVSDREADFDGLLPRPEPLPGLLRERIAERRAARADESEDEA